MAYGEGLAQRLRELLEDELYLEEEKCSVVCVSCY
jgi:hypothetical protein